jgi:hypothetical protein
MTGVLMVSAVVVLLLVTVTVIGALVTPTG